MIITLGTAPIRSPPLTVLATEPHAMRATNRPDCRSTSKLPSRPYLANAASIDGHRQAPSDLYVQSVQQDDRRDQRLATRDTHHGSDGSDEQARHDANNDPPQR